MISRVLLDFGSAAAVLGFRCAGILQANRYVCLITEEIGDRLRASGEQMREALRASISAGEISEVADEGELRVFAQLAGTRRMTSCECAVVATALTSGADVLVREARPVLRALSELGLSSGVTVHSLGDVLLAIAEDRGCQTARAAYVLLEERG